VKAHDALVRVASEWLFSQGCTLVVTDIGGGRMPERPDAIGWRGNESVLIECKASRSDFGDEGSKSRHRDPCRSIGMRRYFMVPAGSVTLEDMDHPYRGWTHGWGLLIVSDGVVSCARTSIAHHGTREHEIPVMLSAMRRVLAAGPVDGIQCRVFTHSKYTRKTKTAIGYVP
jgi:hypothetical protein